MSASLPTGPTASTNAINEALRCALLDFENVNGDTLRGILGENLYRRAAPAGNPFPYGVMRVTMKRSTNFNPLRKIATLEVQLYGRDASQLPEISDAADLCEQAMNFYVRSSPGGLMFTSDVQRTELPEGSAPVDSEICTIRLAFTLTIWPSYLSSLTT